MSHTPAAPASLDALEVLSQLIAIDSVNSDLVPGGAGESAIADWCAAWLTDHGLEVTRLESRAGHPSLVAIARGTGGGATLLLNGHLDTVGVGGYDGDPFSGARETVDGAERVVGRGAFDTKSGVAAVMVAAARALADGALRGDAVLTLVADEEFGSTGTVETLAHLAATGVRPDAAVVVEPSALELTVAHRGFAWFTVEFAGVAAHGSMPEQGVDAIAAAGAFLRGLDDIRAELESLPPHPLLGHGTVRVSTISGGTDEATVADRCVLTVERRTLPGDDLDAVEQQLHDLAASAVARVPGALGAVRRQVARAAFAVEPDSAIVATVAEHVERVLGRPARLRGEPFWTDARLVQEAGIPCVVIGADGGGAHADLEWADAASVVALTDVIEGTIRQVCR
ncbi:MAG: M20/M25/M40 family metallo-hydrolase [Actinobacteria bacterium]|nr:M20/M25/M40 family metallo-hydrolase [Actinomycetota bacterium]MBU1608874.1 M20/M25/M40 family metallo-hydrolase [Actinomycetota bacterium]MBU2314535.1 M20/M25/M40 family metallo-hydrolase [Actinomycetota bacterium]MBU2384270.1 M20/M25/M40 family metallo-hydrolase [Actinomycetota bacterium]